MKLVCASTDPRMLRLFAITLSYFFGLCVQFVTEPALVQQQMYADHTSVAARTNAIGHTLFYGLQFFTMGIWGSISDDRGRKPVLMLAFVVDMTGRLLLAGSPTPWVLYGALAANGALNGSLAALYAAATDLCDDREILAHNMSCLSVALGVALILGPGFGGLLNTIHWRLPLVLTAACDGVAIALLLGMTETNKFSSSKEDRVQTRSVKEAVLLGRWSPLRSLTLVLTQSRLLRILFVPYTVLMLGAASYSILIYYMTWRYDASLALVGGFLSVMGLGVAFVQGVGLPRIVPHHLTQRKGVLVGHVGQFALYLVIAFAPRAPVMFLGLLTLPGIAFLDPCMRAVLANCLDDHDQGALNGALFSIRSGTHAANYLYAWLFIEGKSRGTQSSALPFFVAAALVTLSGSAFALAFRHDELYPPVVGLPRTDVANSNEASSRCKPADVELAPTKKSEPAAAAANVRLIKRANSPTSSSTSSSSTDGQHGEAVAFV